MPIRARSNRCSTYIRQVILIFVSWLVACGTNTGVTPVGPDMFRISKQGSTGFVGSDKIKADVMLEASRYCAERGKTMQVVNVITGQPPYILGNFPKAEVQFRCVDRSVATLAGAGQGSIGAQPAFGEVSISSNVANAEVFVDGKFIGNTPLVGLRLPGGTYAIEVVAKGYVSWVRELTVVSRSPTRVVAELDESHRP
jgi:hypothetical protein